MLKAVLQGIVVGIAKYYSGSQRRDYDGCHGVIR